MAAPDVVVIGAGLAGCSVAWHLAPHRSVLLLEQGEQPGAEASAHNAGMVRRLGEDPYERLLAARTAEWLEDPGEDWADREPSRRTGALLGLTRDPAHLHDAVAHLRSRGIAVQRCDRPGDLAPALEGSPLSTCWYLPDERVADAWSLVDGFLAGARRHAARIRCDVQVLGLRRDGDRVSGVETDDGRIDAGAVVLAGGAWSGPLAAGIGLRRPLVPIRRTLLQTAPHPLSAPAHPWCWGDDEGLYARPEGGGWMVSSCDEVVDVPAPGPGSRGPVPDLPRARAADRLTRLMPALADARFVGGWTGLRTFAPDRRPVLGADPDAPGLWWAAGLGGFGVTCSYAVGEAVASWMRGEELGWLAPDAVSPGRPMYSTMLIRPTGDLHDAVVARAR